MDFQRFRARLLEKLSSYGNHAGSSPSFKDTRSDLGYGRISNKWHDQRSSNSFFPYTDPVEDHDDVNDLDDNELDLVAKISNKLNADIPVNDPFSGYRRDPFTFVGSNFRLSIIECFERPDVVLREIAVVNSSLVPMPGKWRKAVKSGGQGAAVYLTVAHPVRTGMLRGWSSAPFDNEYLDDEEDTFEEKNKNDEEFMSIWDILKNNHDF
jgi:hypothetical protein